jgi:uncharacterized SAM-binding protein YcdF (DUF218 family)
MTLLFFFLVAIFFAVLFKKRRAALVLLAFLAFHLILSGGGVFTRWAMQDLQRAPRIGTPEWKSRNAIVVLGFGTVKWAAPESVSSASFAYARLFEALRLYQSCKKASNFCRLIVSGGDPLHNGESEGEVMARELAAAGADPEDIVTESKSNNTFQNARFSAPLLEGFDKIYLVTSGLHMRRAMLYFSHFVKGIEPAPADRMQTLLSFIPISPNLIYFDFAMHEYIGMLMYRIYNFMGWNPPKVT